MPYPLRTSGYALKRTAWFNMRLIDDGLMSPQEEEGIEQVRWFSISQVIERLGDSYPCMQNVLGHVRLAQARRKKATSS